MPLNACAQEPIHLPGAVQPHGALLALRPEDLVVTHASLNLRDFLGLSATAALGKGLAEVLGRKAVAALPAAPAEGTPEVLLLDQGEGYAAVHRRDGRILVELEHDDAEAAAASPVATAEAVVRELREGAAHGALLPAAARAFRRLTGFDRAMVYRFAADGHGEVVAEDLAEGQAPYLGLRYPASDIPAQARRLYLLQRVRCIADAGYLPVPVTAAAAEDRPLDMSGCAIRSVSPVHLAYMRNMGSAASLTVSLVVEGTLWGLLVCHHRTPRLAGPRLRALCDLLGQVLSSFVAGQEQAAAATRSAARREQLQAVVAALADPAGPAHPAERLARAEAALLELAGASGAWLRLGGREVALGAAPPEAAARAVAAALGGTGPDPRATDDLSAWLPGGAATAGGGIAGALWLPLPTGPGDGLLWTRPELAGTVAWGGDPRKAGPDERGRISPRTSFAAWVEQVRGRSAPWTEEELAAARDLARMVRIAAAAEAARKAGPAPGAAPRAGQGPRMLRLGAPPALGRLHLLPRLQPLLELHPGLGVELVPLAREADPQGQGLDLAIRLAAPGRGAAGRRVGRSREVVAAAPAYLARHGVPGRPEDLRRHACLLGPGGLAGDLWRFEGPGGAVQVAVGGRLRLDSEEAVRSAVLQGLGIGRLPLWHFAEEEVAEGRVVLVLQGWEAPGEDILLVPATPLPEVAAAAEFLAAELAKDRQLAG